MNWTNQSRCELLLDMDFSLQLAFGANPTLIRAITVLMSYLAVNAYRHLLANRCRNGVPKGIHCIICIIVASRLRVGALLTLWTNWTNEKLLISYMTELRHVAFCLLFTQLVLQKRTSRKFRSVCLHKYVLNRWVHTLCPFLSVFIFDRRTLSLSLSLSIYLYILLFFFQSCISRCIVGLCEFDWVKGYGTMVVDISIRGPLSSGHRQSLFCLACYYTAFNGYKWVFLCRTRPNSVILFISWPHTRALMFSFQYTD